MSPLLVSPEWLKGRLGQDGVRIVDGSWYLPAHNRDAKAEFLAGHIPGAVFFSAARVWWTLRVFGARDVRILDGGLPAWKRAGYPLEAGEPHPKPAVFRAKLAKDGIVGIEGVKRLLASDPGGVVDARPAPRFRGEAPEPRPGIPSGHMPGAVNLPSDRLVSSEGRIVAPEQVRKLFEDAGVDLAQPVVTTCGSGVTAAVLLFALATLGKDDVSVYDGAWAEWASQPSNPVVTGSA